MTVHPLALRFQAFSGEVPAGHTVDFLGVVYEQTLFDPNASILPARHEKTEPLPFSGEGYFDWIELLEAVEAARDSFHMIELGAGYGYWTAQGAAAARQRGLDLHMTALEAEPEHYAMMCRHLRSNGLDLEAHDFRFAAVAKDDGEAWFETGSPLDWWGQAVIADPDGYSGQAPLRRVPAVSLNTLLKSKDKVDFLHMDVQGVELDVLTASKAEVDRAVRRIVIGTHSGQIEAGLRALLSDWERVCDFRMGKINDTEYGAVEFGDGLQIYRNPRLQA